MDQLKVLIIEDELIVAEDIKSHLQKMGYTVTGIASSYDEAIGLLASTNPDLILLDIMIKGMKTGIDVGRYLQDGHYKIPFIYLSSLSDKKTIEQAKETHPNAYLLKPFRAENLFASIEIAIENAASTNINSAEEEHLSNLIVKDCLFIKKDNLFYKVKIKDILFIKGEGNYLEIQTNTGNKYLIRSTIKSFLGFLNQFPFFQTHKSYIINLEYIDIVSYTSVKIQNHEIPLSQSKKDELMALMKSFS